jgi:prolyl 4-hydroxylase
MEIQYLSQAVTPELREWILAQAQAGCASDDILEAMHASGWDTAVARVALAQTLQSAAAPGIQSALPHLQAVPAGDGSPVPEPDLRGAPSVLRLPDRDVDVLLTMQRPRVVLFGSFMSDEECDALMELSRPRLARSETVDHHSGGSEVNAARTSDGMFFERGEAPLIQRIEQRIAALLHWPVDRGEGLQILRYRPGAQYRPHFDYFDPAQPGTAAVLRRGGQRVGTLVMYLHVPKSGGGTVFPDVGLEVMPVKGHALFFSYDRPHESTGTLHGGSPVTDGEKWVATKWIRERVFG